MQKKSKQITALAESTFTRRKPLPPSENHEHLKEWRLTLGVSQARLAKEAHVSQALIAQIETGRHAFCEPYRSDIWDAMNGLLYARALELERNKHLKLDPSDPLSFYSAFFGPDSVAGMILGLSETPRERVLRQYRALEFERDEWRRRYEEENRKNKALVDILNLKTKAALSEEEAAEKVAALGLEEVSQVAEEVRSEIEARIRKGK